MSKEFAIDKIYTFRADDGSSYDKEELQLQLSAEEALWYGEYFTNNKINIEEDEVYDSFIRDKLDEQIARSFAQSMLDEWSPESEYYDDEEDEDEVESEEEEEIEEEKEVEVETKTIDDFIDAGYEKLGLYYLGYRWSPEFIQDCIDFYNKHKQLK